MDYTNETDIYYDVALLHTWWSRPHEKEWAIERLSKLPTPICITDAHRLYILAEEKYAVDSLYPLSDESVTVYPLGQDEVIVLWVDSHESDYIMHYKLGAGVYKYDAVISTSKLIKLLLSRSAKNE